MFIIYVIDFSTKNKMYRQGFIFLRKPKILTVGNRKENFSDFLLEIPNFLIYVFFQKILNVSSEHSFKGLYPHNFERALKSMTCIQIGSIHIDGFKNVKKNSKWYPPLT